MNQASGNLRHFTPTLLGITLLALGLRLYALDEESLYMDEIVTVETFHRDPWGVVEAAAIVGQPPLDNFVGVTVYRLGLGQSDWCVRFPAVIFGSSAVFLLGVWMQRLAGAGAGLAAALLLAVCPLHVAMSQEVRPYSLMFFLALACALCYVRARKRNRPVDWTIFATVTFGMLMTRWTDPHFVVLGIGLHAILRRNRTQREEIGIRRAQAAIFRRALLAVLAAYVCYSPFFWIVWHYQKVAIRPPSIDWMSRFGSLLHEGFAALFAGYSTRTVFVALPGSRWLVLAGAVLTLAGLAVAIVRWRRTQGEDLAFWWIFVPFPFVYALVYSLLGNAVPKPQYLLVMAVLVFGCVAVALDAVRSWIRGKVLRRAVFAGLMLILVVPMARNTWEGLSRIDKRDWRGAMGFLKQHAQPGDVAVCMGSDTVPPAFRPKAYGKDRYGPEQLKFIPVSTDTPLDAFADAGWASSNNRVWMLVYTDRMYRGVDHVVPPARRLCHAEHNEAPEILRFAQNDKSGQTTPTQCDNRAVHFFNGLFVVELKADKPAMARIMDTIGDWYAVLPAQASIPAPALLRWRYAVSRGDTIAAVESMAAARGQCPGAAELAALDAMVLANEALAQSAP